MYHFWHPTLVDIFLNEHPLSDELIFFKWSGFLHVAYCPFSNICLCDHSNLSKLAGETYQQTDADFLDSERDTFRDDGSTASTAILVDNHLYVANVGDSRTIISKAGKGIVEMPYNILISADYSSSGIYIILTKHDFSYLNDGITWKENL